MYLLSAGFDVGRGTGSFDEEGRQFIVSSISTKIWHVKEYTYQLLPEEEYGHFYSSEGLSLLLCKYVMRSTNVTIVCVELNGGRKSGIWELMQPQRRRQRQRQRQKTVSFMSKTTALHVHHAFQNFSLTSTARLRRKTS